MTVYFSAPPAPSTTTTTPDTDLKTEQFNIKNRGPPFILQKLVELTGSKEVVHSEEDLATSERINDHKLQSAKDSRKSLVRHMAFKLEKERELLKKGGPGA